jgi:hypothetical protein
MRLTMPERTGSNVPPDMAFGPWSAGAQAEDAHGMTSTTVGTQRSEGPAAAGCGDEFLDAAIRAWGRSIGVTDDAPPQPAPAGPTPVPEQPVQDRWRHAWRVATAAAGVLAEMEELHVLDAGGRRAATEAHHRLLIEIGGLLPDDLTSELARLVAPFEDHTLTAAEATIAQAQLVGWLTGLMEGLRTGLIDGC